MKDNQMEKLWEDYKIHKTSTIREKLILEYSELIKIVAGRLKLYLGSSVEYDDLIGYGTLGLIDAVDKFDYKKGVKFETYASIRIRGAIIDEIRKLDWMPRTVRKKQKDIEESISQIEKETGKVATEEEIAKRLNISAEELRSVNSQIELSSISSLEEYMDKGPLNITSQTSNSDLATPEIAIEKQELKKALAKAIEGLTTRERQVISLYYYEELTLKEISYILDITESRVSQLHRRALDKMKGPLGEYGESVFAGNV
ncbi:MAG: FliA/WhiG family RNA polymerase sigma factor [Clostridiales bacterium]|nr:FliA/WhiG family RNA polymerase sigma factor [Clostridiales bacterium]